MEAEMFGWREGILLLVGLAVLYLLVTLFRLMRVGKGESGEPPKETPRAEPVPPPPQNDTVPELTDAVSRLAPTHSSEWHDVVDLELLGATATPAPAVAAAPRVSGFGEQLAEHLARSDLERDVRLLRKEVNELRAELEELRSARNISPQYAEAVALAQRGLTAQDVADRMGISLAEAELVHALSRGEKIFDEGEDDGADRDARDDRDAGGDRFEPDIGFTPRHPG